MVADAISVISRVDFRASPFPRFLLPLAQGRLRIWMRDRDEDKEPMGEEKGFGLHVH